MKKEFLLGLNIADDIASQIMAENGKDIQREVAKATALTVERDTYKTSLEKVQADLKAFEGVDVADLQGKVAQLSGDLAQERANRDADKARWARESETATFLSGKKFVNAATRDFFAQKINAALETDASKGKSREDLLKDLTTGEDGQPMANIFADENPHKPNLPPAGTMSPADVRRLSGQMDSLHRQQLNLNEHRIVK